MFVGGRDPRRPVNWSQEERNRRSRGRGGHRNERKPHHLQSETRVAKLRRLKWKYLALRLQYADISIPRKTCFPQL